MRVLLAFGPALEVAADGLEERASSAANASGRGERPPSRPRRRDRRSLQDDGGGQQAGEDQAVARGLGGDAQGLDVEALALLSVTEDLLDLPALCIACGDVERVRDRRDVPVVRRRQWTGVAPCGRGLLAEVDEVIDTGAGQACALSRSAAGARAGRSGSTSRAVRAGTPGRAGRSSAAWPRRGPPAIVAAILPPPASARSWRARTTSSTCAGRWAKSSNMSASRSATTVTRAAPRRSPARRVASSQRMLWRSSRARCRRLADRPRSARGTARPARRARRRSPRRRRSSRAGSCPGRRRAAGRRRVLHREDVPPGAGGLGALEGRCDHLLDRHRRIAQEPGDADLAARSPPRRRTRTPRAPCATSRASRSAPLFRGAGRQTGPMPNPSRSPISPRE